MHFITDNDRKFSKREHKTSGDASRSDMNYSLIYLSQHIISATV